MNKTSDVNCASNTRELFFAITNVGDMAGYYLNKRVLNLFEKIPVSGGLHSKDAANAQLEYFKKYFEDFS